MVAATEYTRLCGEAFRWETKSFYDMAACYAGVQRVTTSGYAWYGHSTSREGATCKRAPEDWWIFDDSSLTSGTFAAPATALALARGKPYELGGQITQPDFHSEMFLFFASIKYWKLSVARYQGAVEEAAKPSGAKRSRVQTSASAIQDLSTHVVEKDRPSRRRPSTRRVTAAILTQKLHARRVRAERENCLDKN
eukprot:6177909-Pleurochrysis_carterae.AAC.5